MTVSVRESLKTVEIPVSVRTGDEGFYIRGDDLIDDLEASIIKYPELRTELKRLLTMINQN